MSFSIKGLEIFAVGTWNGDKYSQKDLDTMVDVFDKVGFSPPLKLGHTEDQKFLQTDGLPAAGWVDRIYTKGDKLLADISRIPKKIYMLLKKGAYRHVSSEVYWNLKRNDTVFSRALKAVALLGAEIPAVSGLTPIDAMLEQYMKQFTDNAEDIKTYAFKTDTIILNQEKDDSEDSEKVSSKKVTPGESQMGEHLDKDKKKKDNKDEDKKSKGDSKMTEEQLKKLQKEMQDMKDAMEASSKKHDTEIAEYKSDLKSKDEKVNALGAALITVQKDKADGDIKVFTDALVASGKMAPAVVSDVETLLKSLSGLEVTVKYHNDKKEEVIASIMNFAQKVFSDMPTVVELKELALGGQEPKEGEVQDVLSKKIAAYASEHKVSYGDATSAVIAANPGLAKEYMNQG